MKKTKINTLIFHRIGTFDNPLFSDLDTNTFGNLLRHLDSTRGRSWSIEEAMTKKEINNEIRIVFTFDDGWSSDFHKAFLKLHKRGWRATFFVVSGQVGKAGKVTWSELAEMKNAGMEIGSHTVNHVDLTSVTPKDAFDELTASKKMLSDHLGCNISSFAFPGGYCNRSTIAMARKAGYRWIATSMPHFRCTGDNVVGRTGVVAKKAMENPESILYPNVRQMIWRTEFCRARVLFRKLFGERFYLAIRNGMIDKP